MRNTAVIMIILSVFLLAACQSKIADVPAQSGTVPSESPAASDNINLDEPDSGQVSCKCSDEYDPVCANGQLFNNACTAECLGITNYVKGECHNPEGKQLFPCGVTTGGLVAQHNPVCARVIEVETGISYWKTYSNSLTACNADRMGKIELNEFTRGECGA